MAIYNRAELLFDTGDYRGAIRDYTTLIHTYPNFLQGYQRRAEAKRRIGDTKGALKDEDHVIREQIAHRYGYQSKASKTATTRKKSEIDLDDYQALVVDDEEKKEYESEYRGKIQNKDTEMKLLPPMSLASYQVAASAPNPYFDTALEHLLVEEYEPAIQDFTEAIKNQPNVAEAYYNRAYAYAATRKYSLALEDLDKAIQLRSQFPQAYFNRGIVKIFMNDNDHATADLSKAGELGIYQAYSIIKHNASKKKK